MGSGSSVSKKQEQDVSSTTANQTKNDEIQTQEVQLKLNDDSSRTRGLGVKENLDILHKILGDSQENLRKSDKEIAEQAAEIDRKLKHIENERDELKQQLNTTSDNLKDMTGKYEALSSNHKALKKQLESTKKERDDYLVQLEKTKKELEELKAAHQKLQEENAMLRRKLDIIIHEIVLFTNQTSITRLTNDSEAAFSKLDYNTLLDAYTKGYQKDYLLTIKDCLKILAPFPFMKNVKFNPLVRFLEENAEQRLITFIDFISMYKDLNVLHYKFDIVANAGQIQRSQLKVILRNAGFDISDRSFDAITRLVDAQSQHEEGHDQLSKEEFTDLVLTICFIWIIFEKADKNNDERFCEKELLETAEKLLKAKTKLVDKKRNITLHDTLATNYSNFTIGKLVRKREDDSDEMNFGGFLGLICESTEHLE